MDNLLALLKLQLVINESSQDALLSHYLVAAITAVEKYSGYAIVEKEKSETCIVEKEGYEGVVLIDSNPNQPPIVTCDGVHISKAVFLKGKIYLPCSYIGLFVTVHYRVGTKHFDMIEPDIKQGVLMVAAYMFSHRGDESPKFYGNNVNNPIVNSGAKDLLNSYRKVSY